MSSPVVQWIKQTAVMNTTGDDTYPATAVDSSGNVYVAYATNDTVSGGTRLGFYNIVVFKMNTNGDVVWIKENALMTTGGDLNPTIKVDSSGNVYVAYDTGRTVSGGTDSGGGADIVVFKMDTNGNMVWIKQNRVMNSGGIDQFPSIAIDSSSNVYVSYHTNGTVSSGINLASNDIVVFKLDINGNMVWIKENAVMNTNQEDLYPTIAVDSSGNVYVSYTTRGTVSGGNKYAGIDIVVFKLDINGNMAWIKQDTSINSYGTNQYSATAVDSSGNVYVAYESAGMVSGGLVAGGIVVFKLDTNGNVVWIKQNIAGDNNIFLAMAVDLSGNVYVSYHLGSSISGGTFLGGTGDIIVFKLDTDGNTISIAQQGIMNTTSNDLFPSIAVDASGNAYVSYYTTGTVSGGTLLGGKDIVVFKLQTPTPTSTTPDAPTALYPVPGNQQLTITFTPGSNGGSPITNYQYSIDNGSNYTAFSPATGVVSSVTITGLTNGQSYSIKLKAVNANGAGTASATVTGTPGIRTFTQVGSDIDGGSAGDRSGYSEVLSSDGSIVAIGSPRATETSINFTGASGANRQYVRTSVSNSNCILTGDFTIEMFIKCPAQTNSYPNLVCKDSTWTPSSGNNYYIAVDHANDGKTGKISVFYSGASGSTVFIGTTSVTDDNWHHIAIVRNGSNDNNLKLYIDGVQDKAVSYTGTWDYSILTIGGSIPDGNASFGYKGKITNFRIQNTAAYTANFTVPTSVLTRTASTVFLMANNINNPYYEEVTNSQLIVGGPDLPTVDYSLPFASGSGKTAIYSWNGSSWAKRGSDINGETTGDRSGHSVAMSSDGSVVAIGAPLNDGTGADAGHVRVYAWNGSAWIQRGTDIDGEAAGDQSGYSIAMSSDGSVVAIGAPLNDGTGVDAGQVRVYAWNGTSWVKRGADIDGEAAGDRSGFSISISSDGSVVAIGAPLNDGTGVDAGQVRVYAWNGTSWVKRGVDIDGEAAGDRSGFSISISSDGSILAIGAPLNDGAGTNAGHVRVYAWNGSSWTQRGSDIDGQAAGDQFGYSVALSSDGARLVIGAPYKVGGRVYVYDWDGSSWSNSTVNIDYEAANNMFGSSVSISANGNRVAAGAYLNDGNGNDSGSVRVYAYPGTGGTVPSAPSGVTAIAKSLSAFVSWIQPSNGGSVITSYTITPYQGVSVITDSITIVSGAANTNAYVYGLSNGIEYTFTVTATNTIGASSASTASSAVTPVSDEPTNAVIAGPASITSYVQSVTATTSAEQANLSVSMRVSLNAGTSGGSTQTKNDAKIAYIDSMRAKVGASSFTIPQDKFTDFIATLSSRTTDAITSKPITAYLPQFTAQTATIDVSSVSPTNYIQFEAPIGYTVILQNGAATLNLTYNGTNYSDGSNTYTTGSIIVLGDKTLTLVGIGSGLLGMENTSQIECITKGSMILTPSGYIPIEQLGAGDKVVTGDGRIARIQSMKQIVIVEANAKNAPYVIEKDALGTGFPPNRIEVSPRHAVQLPSGLWEIPREAAKDNKLVYQNKAAIGNRVVYYHFALPNYETDTTVVNGQITETLNDGQCVESYVWKKEKKGYARFIKYESSPSVSNLHKK